MAGIELWRLEHVRCSEPADTSEASFTHYSFSMMHGPYENPCKYGPDPSDDGWTMHSPHFGLRLTAPKSIRPREHCAVTPAQIPYWWSVEYKLNDFTAFTKLWNKRGWQFVIYKLDRRGVRRDGRQYLFLPRYTRERVLVPWAEVPRPKPGKLTQNEKWDIAEREAYGGL